MRTLWTAAFPDDIHPSGGDLALAGMALYSRGINLSEQEVARRGLAALLGEAETTRLASGIWGEDSTLRHLQITANYAAAWLLARRQNRPERGALEAITRSMLAVLPALVLPGGLPAIGDTPEDVKGGLVAWAVTPVENRTPDGWRRCRPTTGPPCRLCAIRPGSTICKNWNATAGCASIRAHGPVSGTPGPMDGCRKMDLDITISAASSFITEPNPFLSMLAVRRPARRPMSSAAAARPSCTAASPSMAPAPTPVANWRYDAAFRRAVGGPPPRLCVEFDGATLVFDGFSRLGGPTQAQRRWSFGVGSVTVSDSVQGTGRRQIERHLVTPLPVTLEDGTVHLHLKGARLVLQADAPLTVRAETGWSASGIEIPLTVISIAARTNLPWHGRLHLEFKDAPLPISDTP